jgi:hypothetical protein
MTARVLSGLALLLATGAALAGPPGVVARFQVRGAEVYEAEGAGGRPVVAVIFSKSATDADRAERCELRGVVVLDLSQTNVTDEGAGARHLLDSEAPA